MEEEVKSYPNLNILTSSNVDYNSSDENKTLPIFTGKSIWKTIIEESSTKPDFSKDVEDQIVPESMYLLCAFICSKY